MQAGEQIFPRGSDVYFARVMLGEDEYIIQSRWDKKHKRYDGVQKISFSAPCAKIQVVIAYTSKLCEEMCRPLRKRADYQEWVKENRIGAEKEND